MPISPSLNQHLSKLEQHFGALGVKGAGISRVRRDARHVFICYTNRCGSNFVAKSLSSSGFLNTAGEFFNADTIIEHCIDKKLDSIADYVNWLVDDRGKNGCLVSKVAISNLEVLAKAGVIPDILDISTFIVVERSDKLGQAISYQIASQTGAWTSDMATRGKHHALKYSSKQLIERMTAVSNEHREFARFFGLNGIVPAMINYEMFETNPAFFIDYLSRFLGLSKICFVPDNVGLRKQAGAVNRGWRDRFNKDNL